MTEAKGPSVGPSAPASHGEELGYCDIVPYRHEKQRFCTNWRTEEASTASGGAAAPQSQTAGSSGEKERA